MNHKARLDKLDARLGMGDDDEIIVIHLTWDEQKKVKPVTYRRGDPYPFDKVVKALNAADYAGENISYDDEGKPFIANWRVDAK